MLTLLARDQPVLVFFGPSAVGKSTIAEQLVKRGVVEITPTWTDRPKRPGEPELEHTFVSSERFDELVSQGFFAHPPLQLFDLPYRYAMPFITEPQPGRIPLLMARAEATPLLNAIYPNRIIYQIEAPRALVAERLAQREQSGDQLGSRLTNYENEMINGREHATRVFINDRSIDDIVSEIIEAVDTDFA